MPERKRKSFAERHLIPSRLRTGKKVRKTRSRRPAPQYSPVVRTQQTTGRIDFDENGQKTFTAS